jgi:hypothetical protein
MEITLDLLAEACYRWRASDSTQQLPEGFYTIDEEVILMAIEETPESERTARQNALVDAVWLQALLRHAKEEQQ